MYKDNWKFKNARTLPYDGTESRDTTSVDRCLYEYLSKQRFGAIFNG